MMPCGNYRPGSSKANWMAASEPTCYIIFWRRLTPQNQLVLSRKSAGNLKVVEKRADGKIVSVPIWMAGDHFVVGMGQINDTPPALLFVDTGLAGAGIKLGGSMLKSATM